MKTWQIILALLALPVVALGGYLAYRKWGKKSASVEVGVSFGAHEAPNGKNNGDVNQGAIGEAVNIPGGYSRTTIVNRGLEQAEARGFGGRRPLTGALVSASTIEAIRGTGMKTSTGNPRADNRTSILQRQAALTGAVDLNAIVYARRNTDPHRTAQPGVIDQNFYKGKNVLDQSNYLTATGKK